MRLAVTVDARIAERVALTLVVVKSSILPKY